MKTRIHADPEEAAELYFALQNEMLGCKGLKRFLNRHFEVISKSNLNRLEFVKDEHNRSTWPNSRPSLCQSVENWKNQLEVYQLTDNS